MGIGPQNPRRERRLILFDVTGEGEGAVRTSRRSFLKAGAAGAGMLMLPVAAPFVKRAYGQGRRTIVFGSGEPLTGNWDPSSHTILAQVNIEALIFGQLIRCPMRPGNTAEIVYELATAQKVVSPTVMEYTLRQGVKFHNGQEFTAKDVKATIGVPPRCPTGRTRACIIRGRWRSRSSTPIPSAFTPTREAFRPRS